MKNRQKELEHTTSATRPVLSGFLVGSVLGAAAALLFAPQSGEETRAEIRGRAVDLRDRAMDSVQETVSQAKSKAGDVRENIQGKVEELKQRGRYAIKRASHAAETGQKVQEH